MSLITNYVWKGTKWGLGLGITLAGLAFGAEYSSKQSELEKMNNVACNAIFAKAGLEEKISVYANNKEIEKYGALITQKMQLSDETELKQSQAQAEILTIDDKISKTNSALEKITQENGLQTEKYSAVMKENNEFAGELDKINGDLAKLETDMVESKKSYENSIISIIDEHTNAKNKLVEEYDGKFGKINEQIENNRQYVIDNLVYSAYSNEEFGLCDLGKCNWTKKDLDPRFDKFANYLNKIGLETSREDAIRFGIEFCAKDGNHVYTTLKRVYGSDEEFKEDFATGDLKYNAALAKKDLWLVNSILEYYKNWGDEEIKNGKDETKVFKNAIWHAGRGNPDKSGTVSITDLPEQDAKLQELEVLIDKLAENDADFYKTGKEYAANNKAIIKKTAYQLMKDAIDNCDSAFNEFMTGLVSSALLSEEVNNLPLAQIQAKYALAEKYLTDEEIAALKETLAKKLEHLEKNRKEDGGLLSALASVVTFIPKQIGTGLEKTGIPGVAQVGSLTKNASKAPEKLVDLPEAILFGGNANRRGKDLGALIDIFLGKAMSKEQGTGTGQQPLDGIGGGQGGGDEFGPR
jgi:hypothetical protein